MSSTNTIPKLFLTGSDAFILALEKNRQLNGTAGNNCRYVLELEGKLDAENFKSSINQNKLLQQLATYSVHKATPVSKPFWKLNPGQIIQITSKDSDELMPPEILNRKISIENPPLFSFDILNRSNGNTCVIFSWNHLLMDGYGAALLLKQMGNNFADIFLFTENQNANYAVKPIVEATKAKFFIQKSSKQPLTSINIHKKNVGLHQKLQVIQFTEEETKQIALTGSLLGAKFGPSPFYLAVVSRAVKSILEKRQTKINNFWIPVPQNKRRKGALGPVLGNHLSFLFYRLNNNQLSSLKFAVEEINKQMVHQVRIGMPKAYDWLMYYLKRIPYSLYHFWSTGPKGSNLSSFLFTLAEDHPSELNLFSGHKVINALSFPPNAYPPGLTFAFMRFNNCLQLMILYYDEILSAAEVDQMQVHIKTELITGKVV